MTSFHRQPAAAVPTVVLLHSSTASARQWLGLMAMLPAHWRAIAVELHGHGAQAPWQEPRPLQLADEAALVDAALARAGVSAGAAPVHLVGHSYGGAVALKYATLQPRRVASLAVYEPVLFAWLFGTAVRGAAAQAVALAAGEVQRHLAAGDYDAAGRHFIDYWAGPASWQALPAERRAAIAARMPAVAQQFGALFAEPLAAADLSRLALPMQFLSGEQTVASTRQIATYLRRALPYAEHATVPAAGHLGPITHPMEVNRRVWSFLERHVEAPAWRAAA